MKKSVLAFVFGVLFLGLQANVTAYFSYGIFNVPNGTPFFETYLTIIGPSIKLKAVDLGFQGSVNIKVQITQDGKIVSANSYNLLSPISKDSILNSGFIDNQRYTLKNGDYNLELTLSDNNDPSKKSFTSKENFSINFPTKKISGSTIELLQSFTKSTGASLIAKSGFDLIPYTINYYADDQERLSFYYESYLVDTVIGKNQPFIYSYYVQRKEDSVKVNGHLGFKKQNASKVNPLLAQLDISKLETGNYYLVIEVRDKDNKMHLEKRIFFQRKNTKYVAPISAETRNVQEFFGNYNNADTLKMFVECLWPISNNTEREWEINQSVKKDPELMKKFIVDFWQKRSADTLDPLKMWLDYYKLVLIANRDFKCGKQKGYYTDRGRVFLQYGLPNQRVVQPSEPYAYPYEIWQYYRIHDNTNDNFYSNKKFVFVNRSIADDCFKLIHSDMRGEVYNDRWQYEVTKDQKSPNIDQTSPNPVIGNRAEDFFNNPR